MNLVKAKYPKLTNLTTSDYDRYFKLGNKFQAEHNLKNSVWSIFEVIEHMNDVACEGTGLTLVYKDHWSDKGPVDKILNNNPTWTDLAIAADDVIKRSGDGHHLFVESFDYNEETGIIELWTGS